MQAFFAILVEFPGEGSNFRANEEKITKSADIYEI